MTYCGCTPQTIGVHALGLVALGGQIQQLLVDLHELGIAAGVAHVVGVVIQGEGSAEELRIGRRVDLHLGDAAAGGVVDALGGGKVHVPVPLLAGVLFDKGDGVSDLLRGVLQHVHDLGAAAFLHAAAGLVLQRGDAAGLVAGAGVFVDHLAVADKVFLEVVDHADCLVEHLFIHAAGEKDVLGAEHLGHLGQDRRAAESGETVGEAADGGIGGDAGKSVRAAALHADDELRGGKLLALKLSGILGKLCQELCARLELVLHLLAGQELDAPVVPLAELFHELVMSEVLAAEAQNQHAARVGEAQNQHAARIGVTS